MGEAHEVKKEQEIRESHRMLPLRKYGNSLEKRQKYWEQSGLFSPQRMELLVTLSEIKRRLPGKGVRMWGPHRYSCRAFPIGIKSDSSRFPHCHAHNSETSVPRGDRAGPQPGIMRARDPEESQVPTAWGHFPRSWESEKVQAEGNVASPVNLCSNGYNVFYVLWILQVTKLF